MAELVKYDDGSLRPIKRMSVASNSNHSGVTDFGNLFQFAPYEGGYAFVIVFRSPSVYDTSKGDVDEGFVELQKEFVYILERDFRSLSGIEDKAGETYEVGPSSAPFTVMGKNGGLNTTNISFTVTEKRGTPTNKYISEYLDRVRNPYSQYKSYGGTVGNTMDPYKVGIARETFHMLYIITDSTCTQVEKGFFLLNMFPTTTNYAELYNTQRGDISTKEININFIGVVRESPVANRIGKEYLDHMISYVNKAGKINLNSYDYNWSISGVNGGVNKLTELKLNKNGLFSSDKSEKMFKGKFVGESGNYLDYLGLNKQGYTKSNDSSDDPEYDEEMEFASLDDDLSNEGGIGNSTKQAAPTNNEENEIDSLLNSYPPMKATLDRAFGSYDGYEIVAMVYYATTAVAPTGKLIIYECIVNCNYHGDIIPDKRYIGTNGMEFNADCSPK